MKTAEIVRYQTNKTEVEQASKPQTNFSLKRNAFLSYYEAISMIK